MVWVEVRLGLAGFVFDLDLSDAVGLGSVVLDLVGLGCFGSGVIGLVLVWLEGI